MKTAELLSTLSKASVDFVLVGGLAVQLHGYMRMTYDIDLVLAMDDENLAKFIDAAKQLGLAPVIPVSIDALRNPVLIEQWYLEKGMLAFALREQTVAGTVVDVLVRPNVSFDRLKADAIYGALLGQRIKVASVDHLIEMKRVANRPKDLLDITALEKIQRGEDPNV
jgi:hypothetical protein